KRGHRLDGQCFVHRTATRPPSEHDVIQNSCASRSLRSKRFLSNAPRWPTVFLKQSVETLSLFLRGQGNVFLNRQRTWRLARRALLLPTLLGKTHWRRRSLT